MRENRTAQTSLFDFYSKHKFGNFLKSISDILDCHPELLALIEIDLLSDEVKATGRKGLSVESIFRCLLLKQITGESYKMLAFHLCDTGSYRVFARLNSNAFPQKSALSGNIRRIKPKTLELVFQKLTKILFDDGKVDINVLRMDSTVVKSNIAPPMDSHLLNDGIRVLSRLFANSKKLTGVKLRLTDYRKKSRSLSARIFYAKKAEKEAMYKVLVPLAWKVILQSNKAIDQVTKQCHSYEQCQFWIKSVRHYQDLLKKVIDQTQRRVFNEEGVPATEKIVSLFEPHTDIIIKGERDIAYGHKINLATDKGGFITALSIEKGNPKDTDLFIPLLEQHQKLYKSLPNTTIADGGYANEKNINQGKKMGINRVGFHKKNGLSTSAMGLKEKTLRKLKNFRAGVEGNISELKRAFGLSKVLWKGEDGFMAFVWSSAISYNLTRWVRLNSE